MNKEQEERLTKQARDTRGQLIVTGARITHYLGSHDGKDIYALEVPEGTWHQSGPYTMTKEEA